MLTDHCMRRASERNPLAFAPPPHTLRNDHRLTPRAITTTATGPARSPSRWASRRGSTWRRRPTGGADPRAPRRADEAADSGPDPKFWVICTFWRKNRECAVVPGDTFQGDPTTPEHVLCPTPIS